jgi:hypothetical protein
MTGDVSYPLFMVCIDSEQHESAAISYACQHALASGGRIGLFQTMELDEFQNWATVEDKMKQELREAGEKELWHIAGHIKETYNLIPEFYIEDGMPLDALIRISAQENLFEIIVSCEKSDLPDYMDVKKVRKLLAPIVFTPEKTI